MKELSIEEKAKAYDEALKEAVIAHKDEDRHLKATLERIFPELAKSKDEMIRKALMDFLVGKRIISNDLEGINIDKTLAWLERQSKASKVEEAMRDIEQKAKAFTEANEGLTSDEILAQMRGEENVGEQKNISDFELSLKHIMEEAIENGDTHNLEADADMLLRIAAPWNEKDENMLDRAIYMMEQLDMTESWDDVYHWLKSLKNLSTK